MGDRCGVSRNKYKYIGKELDNLFDNLKIFIK